MVTEGESVPPLGTLGAADHRTAIVEPSRGMLTYAALDSLATRVANRMQDIGIAPGARIGVYARRSSDAIAAMLGTLRAGCAYIPLDHRAPVERILDILLDCEVQAVFVEDQFETGCREGLGRRGATDVTLLRMGAVGLGRGVEAWLHSNAEAAVMPARTPSTPTPLACILYTSGTTGRPKGWMMSRRAVEAHVRWCHRLLAPTGDDVFANHAQFSFGMSLFDIYSSLSRGARLVLVPDELRQHAARVVEMIAAERVSIWFSGATILSLIAQVPDLERHDLSALRVVAFAGEVFPFPQLNALRTRLPARRYFNFYGSTETNVAAYHELRGNQPLAGAPPLGRPCEHYEARVVADGGVVAKPRQVGELQLRGVGLTSGYWNQLRQTAEKQCPSDDGGEPWFRTGDLAMRDEAGDLHYAGRIGRMIKLRGYRIEPGEIEAVFYQHPAIKEVGVAPYYGPAGLQIVAHVSIAANERPTIVELKQFCATRLPAYMVPERFEFYASLPRTSSGKIDLQKLQDAGAADVA